MGRSTIDSRYVPDPNRAGVRTTEAGWIRRVAAPIRLAAAGICLGAAGATHLAAQTVVPVHEEPRHRLVHQTDALQVLDIGFQAGDTTLFHTHDRPIAYVEIDATVVNQQRLGGSWGRVSETAMPPRRPPGRVTWNENYADAPVTHRVTAIGPGAFRLIGIISRGSGTLAPRVGNFGPSDEPDASSRYFSRLSFEVGPRETMAWTTGTRPVVMVVASNASVATEASDPRGGARQRVQGPGGFVLLEPGVSYRIVNRTEAVAILAFVEVR